MSCGSCCYFPQVMIEVHIVSTAFNNHYFIFYFATFAPKNAIAKQSGQSGGICSVCIANKQDWVLVLNKIVGVADNRAMCECIITAFYQRHIFSAVADQAVCRIDT